MEAIFQTFPAFLLVFCRITSFFVTAPIYSARNVPTHFKIGISFFVSVITFSLIQVTNVTFDGTFVLMILKEILVGLLLGFIAYMFFTIVQIAGSFVDMQMGLSISNVIDPMSGVSSPMIGNLKFVIATLLFLSFNGHHFLIRAIIGSYEWVPMSPEGLSSLTSGTVVEFLIRSFVTAFSLAFQMAAPIVAALFLVDTGMGILARTAPQFNIFVIGVPIKILVGYLLLLILIPGFAGLFSDVFKTMFESMQKLLELAASG